MSRYSKREREAVNAVSTMITSTLNWLFREQPLLDFGIDGHMEIVSDDNPLNKIFAIQIKGGNSYLVETEAGRDKYFTYYITNTHYHYWINSSIPVIGFFHDDQEKIYWQKLDKSTIEKTRTAFKVKIPIENIIDEGTTSKFQYYYDHWTPIKQYPYLNARSKFDKILGIENYLVIVQSLASIKNALAFHSIIYDDCKANISCDQNSNIEDISFNDLIKMQKLKLSIKLLSSRLQNEIEHITSMAAEQFRAYASKTYYLYDSFKKGETDLEVIKSESDLANRAEEIIIKFRDDIINSLNIDSLSTSVHTILDEEYGLLVNLVDQIKQEIRYVGGYHKLVSAGFKEMIKQIEHDA